MALFARFVLFVSLAFTSAIPASLAAAAGEVDPAFQPSGSLSDAQAVAVQPDKKILLGGTFPAGSGQFRSLARFETDGTPDLSFVPDLVAAKIYSIVVLKDGKILVGGYSLFTLSGTPLRSLVRLTDTGALDTSFITTFDQDSIVKTIFPQPNDLILVGGDNLWVTPGRRSLVRLNSNGTYDSSFTANILEDGIPQGVATLALGSSGGKILVGGTFNSVDGSPRSFLTRLDSNGTLDSTFVTLNFGNPVSTIALQANDKLWVGGQFQLSTGFSRNGLALIGTSGSLDNAYISLVDNNVPYSLVLQTNGQLLYGGTFSQPSGPEFFVRLLNNYTQDTSFIAKAKPDFFTYGLALQADGKPVLVGSFLLFGDNAGNFTIPRQRIASLLNDPATETLTATSTSVQWDRDGSSPETHFVTFESSPTGLPNTWTLLGSGTRISGGWQLNSLSLPASFFIRARARTVGGFANASSGLVETIKQFNVTPVLTVTGGSPATAIPNGATTTSPFLTGNGTDFGSVLVCANPFSVSHTFTVTNPGTGSVNLTGITFSGANPGDFSVTPAFTPATLTGPGSTTTFTVVFNPAATGPRSATLTIATSIGAYTFAVAGTGLAPQISVLGGLNSLPILDNSTATSVFPTGNGTDFGTFPFPGSVTRTFTIVNTGTAPLNLTGSPRVIVEVSNGVTSPDFTCSTTNPVQQPATSPLNPLFSTTFQITFNPTCSGVRTATVIIRSDDCSNEFHTFRIRGQSDGPCMTVDGTVPFTGPFNVPIANGDLVPSVSDATDFGSTPVGYAVGPHTFVIKNNGNTSLNIPKIEIINYNQNPTDDIVISLLGNLYTNSNPSSIPFTISATSSQFFQVIFRPNAAGDRTAQIKITSDDPVNPTFIFAIKVNGIGKPEIRVTGGNLNNNYNNTFQNLDSTPSTNDGTDFGLVVGGSSSTNIFKIYNDNSASPGPLTLTGPQNNQPLVKITGISPPNNTDFTVPPGQMPTSTISYGTFSPFKIMFNPAIGGPTTRTALVTILNDDSDESPYTFTIQGTTGQPGILVKGNSLAIANNDLTPGPNNDNTNLGYTLLNNPLSRPFTVTNTGTSPLTITATAFPPTEFTVTPNTFTVNPGPPVTFYVSLTPVGPPGPRNGIVYLTHNASSTTSPYTFAVSGTSLTTEQWKPNMRVIGNNNLVPDNSNSTQTAFTNHTNFGSTSVNGGLITRTFRIENHGPAPLNITSLWGTQPNVRVLNSNGSYSSEFTCSPSQQPTPTTIAGIGPTGIISFTTFSITFNPSSSLTRNATVQIFNNDPGNLKIPYNFSIRGEGTGTGGGGGGPRMATIDDSGLSFGQPRAFSWGLNALGQLGNGSTTPGLSPALGSALAGLSLLDVAAGENHSLALAADGIVHVWGDNSLGQLGTGGNPAPRLVPDALPAFVGVPNGFVNIVHVAAGRSHSLALAEDGRIFAWGANSQGQLGNGSILNQPVPILVNQTGPISTRTIVALAAGEHHSAALASDGTVFTWGGNTRGQLGTANTTPSLVPVMVDLGARKAVSLVAGPAHTLILTDDGFIFGWGRNDLGQLGDGSSTDRLMPTPLFTGGAATGRSFVFLATGASHTLALADDFSVFGCGDNSFGQLGTGDTKASLSPIAIPGFGPGLALRGLAAGPSHSVFLATDGRFFGCGENTSGQLGTGDTMPSLVRISGLPGTIESGSSLDRVISGPFASHNLLLVRAPAPFGALGINDNPDFGRTPLGGTLSRTVNVINNGLVPLLLTGTPPVVVSGDNAGDFTVVQPTVTSVAPGGTLAVMVNFMPSASGLRTALLSVATNDPNNPVLGFNVFGSTTTPGTPAVDFINPGLNNAVNTIAVQPDGGILIGGLFTGANPGGITLGRLARLDPTGILDTSFNPNANGTVRAIAVQFDNSIVVGGDFTTIGGQPRSRVARINKDGSVHPLFTPNFNGNVTSIAIQPNRKILVAGSFTTVNGIARLNLARLNSDGSLDTAFNPAPNRAVYTIALQADGKILIGGNFDSVSGTPRSRLARLNLDGSPDTSFTIAANSDVTAIYAQPGSRIIISGQFTTVSEGGGAPISRIRLARINLDGTLDSTFQPQADSAVYAMAVQQNSKILIAGAFNNINGVPSSRLARLNFDGTLDTTFVVPAPIDDLVLSLALDKNGSILLGGYFIGVGTANRPFLTRLDNDPANETLTTANSTSISWSPGQTFPKTSDVIFEQSFDEGLSWSFLGVGSGTVSGGWELKGTLISGDGILRARGRALGGPTSGGLIASRTTAFTYPAAPSILVSPLDNQMIREGETATFSVVASGYPLPTYQWMKVGGALGSTPIPGATEATYMIGSVSLEDAGSYRVLVTNASGTALSEPVFLAVSPVNSTPVIHIQPVGQSVMTGDGVTFFVAATGSPVPAFQWHKDGKAINGANTSSLSLPFALPTDAGSYTVVVSNSVTSVTSTAAMLNVIATPDITSASSATFLTGISNLFTVNALGNPTPTLSVTGLPAWASFNTTTGALSGTPTEANATGSPYTLQFTATNTAGVSPAQPFTLTVKSRFQVWREANFTSEELANPAFSGPDADPDADGISNLLRFALGNNPMMPTVAKSSDGTRVLLRFRRPVLNPGVRYDVETSTNLGIWTTEGVDLMEISNDGTMSTWEASAPAGPTEQRRFLHLKVSPL